MYLYDALANHANDRTIYVLHGVHTTEFSRRLAEENNKHLVTDPFVVSNTSQIIDQIEKWKANFGFVRPYFALKAQHNEITRRLFHGLGLGYDCASHLEIKSVLETGCSPENIVVAHPYKSYDTIADIIEHNMVTVVDSLAEIQKMVYALQNYEAKSLGHRKAEKIRVLIRLKPAAIAKNKVSLDLSTKFGVDWDEFEDFVKFCQKQNLVTVEGISFHVGLRAEDSEPWVTTVKFLRKCWSTLESYGYSPNILDIGGGYKGRDKEQSFPKMARIIKNSISDNFDVNKIRVIAEPGTFMVATSQSISSCVMGKKSNSQGLRNYYLSAGVYNAMMYRIADPKHQHDVLPLLTSSASSTTPTLSRLWGVTCDSGDDLGYYSLPELKLGDWVIYTDVGDYFMETVTLFNGFLPPKYIYCCEDRHSSILQRLVGDKFEFVDVY